MNKKSNQIQNELDQTTKRLDELTEMRDRLNNNLQTLQSGFVDGKASLDNLQTEQSKLTTLDSSIKALEAKQSELRDAFQKASLSESRQNLLDTARAAALEAETLFNQALEIRRELDNKTGELAEKFCDRLFSFHAKKREYMKLRGQLEPTTKTPGLSNDVVLLLEKNHLNFPPIRFGLSVDSSIRTIEAEREKSELAKRQAEKARQMSSGRY